MVDAPSSKVIVQSCPEETRCRGSHQPNVGDIVDGAAERCLVTCKVRVVALFADQNLADGFAADRRLDRVLHSRRR